MEPVLIDFDPESIVPDPDNVRDLLGKEIPRDDPMTRDLIPELIEKCRRVSTPRAVYLILQKEEAAQKAQILMGDTSFLVGKTIQKMLHGSELYALFLATTGPGPESVAREYMAAGDYLEGYISNIAGSALVEEVAEKTHQKIAEEANRLGMKITNRYSPGYCGWDVSEQQKLFSLFPNQCCGITLTESSLMTPIKSVSGLVGAGKEVKFRDYTCEICSMKDCTFRRTRATHGSLS